ncbi:hypothetical protein M3Y98_00014200 [Aphelenchoides besseyi]|nr:hypothetical protein M3Y98_00014200 [Aphelenchoides besseyi]
MPPVSGMTAADEKSTDREDESAEDSYEGELEDLREEFLNFDVNALKEAVRGSENPEEFTSIGTTYNMSFKMLKSDSRLVKAILFSYGFVQCSAKNPNFNLFWSNTHINAHSLRALKSWQRINHFPRSFLITKKDELYIHLNRAHAQYGIGYDFIPESYNTPMSAEKRQRLKDAIVDSKQKADGSFILKPANSSRGRGIVFLTDPDQVDDIRDSEKVLISKYINNPYLIQNKKSDLRIYVAVTSFYPLIAYIYSDGLARFAVDDYSKEFGEQTNEAHLTNYSLHKSNPAFIKNTNTDSEAFGHKWTLSGMLRQMKENGVDVNLLMVRIEDLIIKTLLSIQRVVASSCRKLNINPRSCFELFGFDVLIDEDLKPWLLEVNLSPSDAPLDSIIKSHLICNLLNLICLPLVTNCNVLNKSYILSNRNPIDELSTAVSSTSVGASSSSASASPSTVDSGQDIQDYEKESTRKPTPLGINTRYNAAFRNKRQTIRSIKPKRKQQYMKVTYSAANKTPLYNQRINLYLKKIKEEEGRMQDFIRVFPRPESRILYQDIFEDTGSEQWDHSVQQALFGDVIESTRREYEQLQNELMNAAKFKNTSDLSSTTRRFLKTAFATADKYLEPFYENEMSPFPKSIPRLRFGLRKRTLSAIDFDLRHRAEVESRKSTGTVEPELCDLLLESYIKELGQPRCLNP